MIFTGLEAEDEAWRILAKMQRAGDDADAQIWMRIIVAISELQNGGSA